MINANTISIALLLITHIAFDFGDEHNTACYEAISAIAEEHVVINSMITEVRKSEICNIAVDKVLEDKNLPIPRGEQEEAFRLLMATLLSFEFQSDSLLSVTQALRAFTCVYNRELIAKGTAPDHLKFDFWSNIDL